MSTPALPRQTSGPRFDHGVVIANDVWYREIGDRLLTLTVYRVRDDVAFVSRSTGLKRDSDNRHRSAGSMKASTILRHYKLYSRTSDKGRL